MSSESNGSFGQCELIQANVDNLVTKTNEPDKQEFFLNYVAIELLDYRLATLPDNQAWDFLAQDILKNLG